MLMFPLFYSATAVLYGTLWPQVSAEVFASMADVETLITTEKLVLDILQQLLRLERLKLTEANRVTKHLKNFGKDGLSTRGDDESAFNPVRMFQRLKNHWTDLNFALDLTSADVFTERNQSINKLRLTRIFPDKSDIEGNADAFARLQLVYKIHPQDIARGRIPGTRRTMPFTSEEAFMIGHNQATNEYYNSAAAWLEAALEIYSEEAEDEKTADLAEILDWLQHSMYHDTGNAVRALELVHMIKDIEPTYPTVDVNIGVYEGVIANLTDKEITDFQNAPNSTVAFSTESLDYINVTDEAYEALCRGEQRMDPSVNHRLKCYYQTHGNPYLLIQPVKVEKVYDDPEILVLHNVFLKSQADRLREIGHKHLVRGRVMDQGADSNGIVSKYRTAKIAFLNENVDPVIPQINRYIGHATNLDMNIAEELQINNYGIGGHYSPHYDFFTNPHDMPNLVGPMNNHSIWGDRIATFLAYMTDVEAGGATVFPRINLTLFPEKGTAAFWFNKFKDVSPDVRTLHAGCPVLSGIKWVSNKWIREKGQDTHRPCGLRMDGFTNLTEVLESFNDGY